MKRVLSASVLAGFLMITPAVAAKTPTRQHVATYSRLYAQVVHKFDKRTPGRNIVRDGLSTGHAPNDVQLQQSTDVLRRMLAPPPPPPPAQPVNTYNGPTSSYTTAPATGGYANVPGVPSSFAACVAQRESTDGAGSSNIYGILGSGGQGTLAEQKAAFSQMYAARGTQPWASYDGC